MKKTLVGVLVLGGIVSLLASSGSRVLSPREASATKGGDIIQGKRCVQVATCDSLNDALGGLLLCPNQRPDQSCIVCQFGSTPITNCVVNPNFACNFQGAGYTQCGLKLYGSCNWGNTCQNAISGTDACTNGPGCE